MRFGLICLLLPVCQDPAATPQRVDDLRRVFTDNFAQDSRSSYLVVGAPQWGDGRLTLSKDDRLTHKFTGGPRVAVQLTLGPHDSACEFRLVFRPDDATPCILRVRTRANVDSRPTEIALLEPVEADGKLQEQAVRQLTADVGTAPLQIEYRYGMVSVVANGSTVFRAHIENRAAPIRGITLESRSGPLVVRSLQIDSISPEPTHSAEDNAKLEDTVPLTNAFYQTLDEGRYEEAVSLAEKVLAVRRSVLGEWHPYVAESLNEIGAAHTYAGRYHQSAPLYKRAIEIERRALGTDHPGYSASLNNLATLYHFQGDYALADKYYSESLAIDKLVLGTEHPDYSIGLNNLGMLCRARGDYDRARQMLEEAARISRETCGEKDPEYAISLDNLGSLYEDLGEFRRAEALFREALTIRREVLGANHPDLAESLGSLSSLLEAQGDFAGALPLAQQAADLNRTALGEDHPIYAGSLGALAGLYEETGDYARAESLYLRSLEIREQAVGIHHPEYAAGLNNLALLYERIGQDERSVPLLEKAMEAQKEARGAGHPEHATVMDNLAVNLRNAGDYDRARAMSQRAVAMTAASLGRQHPDFAKRINNLGTLYAVTGEYDRARELYVEALQTWSECFGPEHPYCAQVHNNLGLLFVRKGERSRAQDRFLTGLAIAQKHLKANSVVQSDRQQRRNQAEREFLLSLAVANALETQEQLDELCSLVWDWKGAVTRRQASYRAVGADPRLAPLFRSLQSLTRQLSATAGQAPLPPSVDAGVESVASYNHRRERWEQHFSELRLKREQVEQQIAAASTSFRETREPVTVREVQSLLPSDAAFIDFLEYNQPTIRPTGPITWERRFVAFVVRKGQPATLLKLGAVSDIASLITDFRRPLASETGADAASRAGVLLRQQLWEAAASHLEGITTIFLSPDTSLGRLPFASLPGRKPESYLLEDYRLVSVPFAGLLRGIGRAANRDEAGQRGLLVLGDIDYDAPPGSTPASAGPTITFTSAVEKLAAVRGVKGRKWASLPGFARELDIVTALHRQRFGSHSPVTTLRRSQATESAFLESAPRHHTLHLVTHAYFADPNRKSISQHSADAGTGESSPDRYVGTWAPALLSGLVLGGANRDQPENEQAADESSDGLLLAADIEASSMPKVDLVVLSACETALGPVAGGEGLTGLQRAFHIAGTRTVIASLWKVDDRATQELMRRFYTNLWVRGLNKVDALREAQLWMLNHPDELAAVGIAARTRGDVRDLKPADGAKSSRRTTPYYWAAFSLSGSWR